MENENKPTLEQRVADLEAAMNEMATIIAPAALRTLGTTAVLLSAVRAAADLVPPESLSARLIRQFLDDAGRDLHGSLGDAMTLQQFDSDRADLENRLNRDPSLLAKSGAAG